MSLVLEAGRHVPDDLLAMPDAERYELVDGVLVEKETGAHASWVATRLSRFLGAWAEERGLG